MVGVDGLEGFMLAGRSRRRAAGVGRVEVGDAVRVGLGFAQNGPCLVLENRVVEAHLGEYGRHAVGALGVGDPPSAPRRMNAPSRCTNSRWWPPPGRFTEPAPWNAPRR